MATERCLNCNRHMILLTGSDQWCEGCGRVKTADGNWKYPDGKRCTYVEIDE